MKELLILSDTLLIFSIDFSLIWHLQKKERFGYLMEEGATPHTAKESIRALRGVFRELNGVDRIINKGLWPPRSPDFYLWGKLKSVVYATKPHDVEARKQNMREAIYNIQERELQQVAPGSTQLPVQCILRATSQAYDGL
jgi:hypothetical protein